MKDKELGLCGFPIAYPLLRGLHTISIYFSDELKVENEIVALVWLK